MPSAAILSGRQTSSFAGAKTTRLLTINGVTLHVLSSCETGHLLTASIDVPGHASPTVVEVGLPGDGLQARAILDSIHLSRAGGSPHPRPPEGELAGSSVACSHCRHRCRRAGRSLQQHCLSATYLDSRNVLSAAGRRLLREAGLGPRALRRCPDRGARVLVHLEGRWLHVRASFTGPVYLGEESTLAGQQHCPAENEVWVEALSKTGFLPLTKSQSVNGIAVQA